MAKLRDKMRFLSSVRILRVTLALAVASWMAGAGCMLGCENMASAATVPEAEVALSASAEAPVNAANIVVTADACASMQTHGCCAKRKAQSVAKTRVTAGVTSEPTGKTDKPVINPSAKATQHTTASGNLVIPELLSPFSTMMDCPLAVNATAALSKARSDESGAGLLQTRIADSFSYFKEQLTALTPPSLLPNRGHTYLRCCVFLI